MKQYLYITLLSSFQLGAMHTVPRYALFKQAPVSNSICSVVRNYAVQPDDSHVLKERVQALERLSWGLDEDRASKALHGISITLANMYQEQIKSAQAWQEMEKQRIKIEQQQLKQARLQTKVHGTLGALACAILYQQLGNQAHKEEVRSES